MREIERNERNERNERSERNEKNAKSCGMEQNYICNNCELNSVSKEFKNS